MQIDKSQIIDVLTSQGEHDKAERAGKDLPEQVDTDQHADKLSKLGINTGDLLGGSGLGGKLGS